MKPAANFAVLLTSFFTQRLIQQRHASPHTISSYRDTFRLLLLFAKDKLSKEPSQLTLENIDAPLVGAFLDELEEQRGIGARSRNLRLTAIRSFFRYAAFECPAQSGPIQRVLAIPCKRCVHKQVHYLTRPEVDALLAAPDRSSWLLARPSRSRLAAARRADRATLVRVDGIDPFRRQCWRWREGTRDAQWVIKRAKAFLNAGAHIIMIESEGITENVEEWRTDAAAQIIGALGIEKIMFEAADPPVFEWYVKNYGAEVNLFVDHSQIVQLECLRSRIWGTKSSWGRVVTYRGL